MTRYWFAIVIVELKFFAIHSGLNSTHGITVSCDLGILFVIKSVIQIYTGRFVVDNRYKRGHSRQF